MLPRQTLGDRQSVLLVQVVRQTPVPQANGLQLDDVTVWQTPLPVQVRAGVNVDPLHAEATHGVPLTYSRQAPAPLQVPSLPQESTSAGAHWLSGSCPAATLVQVPRVPASAH